MPAMAPLLQIGQDAHGIIAIGQFATGVIAIGQVATGVIAIGQVARGVVAVGMGAVGLVAFGMGAAGVLYGGGMMACGGRVNLAMVRVPLVPARPAPASGWLPPLGWWAVGAAQLVLLAALAWAFWMIAGVPLGDALLGPDGILR